jgi:hypothetical protein
VSVVEGGRCHQLVINDVQLSDAGQYAIVAAAAVDHVNDNPSCLTVESSATLAVEISSVEGLLPSRVLCACFNKRSMLQKISQQADREMAGTFASINFFARLFSTHERMIINIRNGQFNKRLPHGKPHIVAPVLSIQV